MKTERIELYAPGEFAAGDRVSLTTYIANDEAELKMPPRPAMIVIPGGGYQFLSDREAEPIAKAYFARGYQAFVLRYSIKEYAVFPRPLVEASRAVVHVRTNAEKYNVDPDRIYAVGFSAGGHLTASLGILWHEEFAKATPDMPAGLNRPNGIVLAYPVITGGQFAHKGSIYSILGTKTPTADEEDRYSLEKHVTKYAAPAYIWHTSGDRTVPVQNSLFLAQAYAREKIPFELRVFPRGPHGLALSTKETWSGKPEYLVPEAAQWVDESCDFLNSLPGSAGSNNN